MNTLDKLITVNTTKLDFNKALSILINDPDVGNLSYETTRALAWLYKQQCKKEIKAAPITNPLKLASLFAGKNDTRYYLNHVYSTGTELIASSGHVLIKIQHEYEKGYFDGAGQRGNIDQNHGYPDYNRVFVGLSGALMSIDLDNCTNDIVGKVHRCKYGDWSYNKEYINLIKKCNATNTRIGEVGTLYFDIPEMKAVGAVMPLR